MRILKNEPIPERTPFQRWGFHLLDPGDCLAIDNNEEYRRAARASSVFSSRTGIRFERRRNTDGPGGKIWRVEDDE